MPERTDPVSAIPMPGIPELAAPMPPDIAPSTPTGPDERNDVCWSPAGSAAGPPVTSPSRRSPKWCRAAAVASGWTAHAGIPCPGESKVPTPVLSTEDGSGSGRVPGGPSPPGPSAVPPASPPPVPPEWPEPSDPTAEPINPPPTPRPTPMTAPAADDRIATTAKPLTGVAAVCRARWLSPSR
jgi:hypothetical protein